MHQNHRATQSDCESDVVESTVQPNLVDINDNVKKERTEEHSLAFKPSLKPLKWSKIRNKMNQRQLDTPQFEMPQKKIIYVKTFNHVKNEQIVNMYENNLAKIMSNTANEAKNIKNWPHGKNKKRANFDSQINLDFFKANKEKFNPLKMNKPKKVPKPKPEDDNSAINEFAFLTGVNIMGMENNQEEEEEEEEYNKELEVPSEANIENKKDESANQELQNLIEEQRAQKVGKTSHKNLLENTNLPTIKRAPANNQQVAMSISEARYKNHINQKPKMYISFKTNSVQPYGRPETYQDHLVRVFNKEGTPVAPHPLTSYFGPKKDYRKTMLDTYLSQFNLEALKEMDEDLYQIALEKQREKEKRMLDSVN